MLRKMGLVGAVVVGAAIVFGALAPAASAQDTRGEIDLRGRGVLGAHGSGVVALKGAGEVYLNANRGILLVKDLGGDAVVEVEGGGGTGEWNGFDVYFGSGKAHIAGRDVAVIVIGTDIDLRAKGKGWAYLQGRGYYFVNRFGPFPWHERGGFAAIDDGAANPPPESE
jgi:hypothetical protein